MNVPNLTHVRLMLTQDANDLSLTELASLHPLFPFLENMKTRNAEPDGGAGQTLSRDFFASFSAWRLGTA